METAKNGGTNHLKAWRLFKGLSLEALADKVNTSAGVLSDLEAGKRGLSAKWLRRLAPHLGTTPGWLLDHDPNSIPRDIMDAWAKADPEAQRTISDVIKAVTRDTGTNG